MLLLLLKSVGRRGVLILSAGAAEDVACLRGIDQSVRIFLEHEALLNQLPRRAAHCADESLMSSVPLLDRQSRVAVGEPLAPGLCKRNVSSGQAAEIWSAKIRIAHIPAGVRSKRNANLQRPNACNVEAILIRPGNELPVRWTELGRL